MLPDVAAGAWANRIFHHRAAVWMAQQGVTQFIDIGCGLPARSSTHSLVHRISPAARVAYVDHDPMVIARAQDLLTGSATAVMLADVRDPRSLLAAVQVDGLIDAAGTVGVLCTGVLQFVADADDPGGCVQQVMSALAPGSCLAVSHMTADEMPSEVAAACTRAYQDASEHLYLRTRAEVEAFFGGLALVPPCPGVRPQLVHASLRGADAGDSAVAAGVSSRLWWAGAGRKS